MNYLLLQFLKLLLYNSQPYEGLQEANVVRIRMEVQVSVANEQLLTTVHVTK